MRVLLLLGLLGGMIGPGICEDDLVAMATPESTLARGTRSLDYYDFGSPGYWDPGFGFQPPPFFPYPGLRWHSSRPRFLGRAAGRPSGGRPRPSGGRPVGAGRPPPPRPIYHGQQGQESGYYSHLLRTPFG